MSDNICLCPECALSRTSLSCVHTITSTLVTSLRMHWCTITLATALLSMVGQYLGLQQENLKQTAEQELKSAFYATYRIPPNSLILDRKTFIFQVELYSNWSAWENVTGFECSELRYRKCRDESWRQLVEDPFQTKMCPFLYIVETRRWVNASQCKTGGSSMIMKDLQSRCGIRPNSQTKIMGGKEVKPHSWPWQVGLYISSKYTGRGFAASLDSDYPVPFCSSTLLAPNWLITAAHCLTEIAPTTNLPIGRAFNYEALTGLTLIGRAGDHNRRIIEASQRDSLVSSVTLHPKYRKGMSENGFDIAILKLKTPFNLSREIDVICLPDKNFTLPISTKCFATGWGESTQEPPRDRLHNWMFGVFGGRDWLFPFDFGWKSRGRQHPLGLTEVELPIVPIEKCQRQFHHVQRGVHICAGGHGRDTCKGDSGGGLFCKSPADGRWYIYGITSFGSWWGCGKNYGVYTCTRGISDWLHSQIR